MNRKLFQSLLKKIFLFFTYLFGRLYDIHFSHLRKADVEVFGSTRF